MSIVVQKRPYNYCFSGNPVHYELYSSQAAADSSISFEVRIMFKNIGGSYSPTPAIPYDPVNGIATIDIQDALDGLLEYQLPGFSVNEKQIWPAASQTAEFYLQYREITSFNTNPSWDDAESDYERFVSKGGLSRWKYQGNNFWINYFNTINPNTSLNPFLTWQKRGRMAAITERMYLLFLNVTSIADANLQALAKVFYTDGTNAQAGGVNLNLPSGMACYIPAGAFQWGLDQLDTTKDIYYWEITVMDYTLINIPAPVSESFRYYADNRNNYNDITLAYRNSLGGLDSARIRGVIEYDLNYNFTEQAVTQQPDYFNGDYFTPQKVINNAKEQMTYKGDIGHLGKEEQDRLRDIHLNRETWWEVGKKWWPMNLVTKSNKHRTTLDSRWSVPVEFTHAHDGDSFYTPMSVDLGNGTFTDNVCLAYLAPLNVTIDLSGTDALVTASFTENDPQNAATQFRYRVLDSTGAAAINWTTLPMASTPFTFHLPKNFVYSLEAQAICTNNIYGKKTTAQVDTNAPAGGGTIGGGGTTPSGNSELQNNTSIATNFTLAVNTTAQSVSGQVGGNNTYYFSLTDTADALVTVDLDFSPSNVRLFDSSGMVHPDSIVNNRATFSHVNIVGGITIIVD